MFGPKEYNRYSKLIYLFKIRISTILLQCYYCTFFPDFEHQIIRVIRESLYHRNAKILLFDQAV